MPSTKSIAELEAEVAAKKAHLVRLQAQRTDVAKHLESLDGEIAVLVGRTVAPKRRAGKKAAKKAVVKKGTVKKGVAKKAVAKRKTRPKKGRSLADVLAKALVGKGTVKVSEAAKLALAAGYRSTSNKFGNMTSQALVSDKRFRKIARGLYARKG